MENAPHDDSLLVKDFRSFILKTAAGRTVPLTAKTASPAASTNLLSSPYTLALQRLISSNTPRSAFNKMAPSMIRVPLRTRVLVNGGVISASETGEGAAKLFRRLNLTNLDTETAKFAATVAVSQEFIDEAPELAGRVLSDALAEAVARAADVYFLSKLNAGETAEGNSEVNPTFADMLRDLSELVRLVKTGEASRLFLIFDPGTLKTLSAAAYGAGVTTVKYNNGDILGIPCIASDSQTDGTVTLADASGIAYGEEGIEVRSSKIAAVEMNDAATNASATSVTGTALVSCFQTNTVAVIAEQRIAVRVAAPNCVASLTGLQWDVGGNSPVFA